MPRCAALILLFAAACLTGSAQSVPFIDQPLVPTAIKDGGPGFTLTVNGGGFVAQSVVLWNGSPVATTYVSSRKLTAQIPASKIASPETAVISVSSGAKLVSSGVFLQVEATRPAVAFTASSVSAVDPQQLALFVFDRQIRKSLRLLLPKKVRNPVARNPKQPACHIIDRLQQAIGFHQLKEDLLEKIFHVRLIGHPLADEIPQPWPFFRDHFGDPPVLLDHRKHAHWLIHPSIPDDGQQPQI